MRCSVRRHFNCLTRGGRPGDCCGSRSCCPRRDPLPSPTPPGSPIRSATQRAPSRCIERIALLGPVAERPGQLTRCHALALSIADHANSARALLRITRLAARRRSMISCPLPPTGSAASTPAPSSSNCSAYAARCSPTGPAAWRRRPGAARHRRVGPAAGPRRGPLGRCGDQAPSGTLRRRRGPDPGARPGRALRAGRRPQPARTGRTSWPAPGEGLRAEVSPEAVRRLLDAQAEPFIQCTGPVARALDESLAHGDPHSLEPVLSRLVRVGHDAEPTVRAWLEHRPPQAQRTAALLLAERHTITTDTAELVGGLLSADDDLLRSRAIARVAPGPPCVQMSVTTRDPGRDPARARPPGSPPAHDDGDRMASRPAAAR